MLVQIDRWERGCCAAELPLAVPRSSRYSPGAEVVRFVDAEGAIELALPSAVGGMSSLLGAGGGVSVGGAVVTSDYGPVQCGSGGGAGVELARHGARVWAELEKRRYHRQAGGAIWTETPCPIADAHHWHG